MLTEEERKGGGEEERDWDDMDERRKGRQMPTRSFVLPYEETEGAGAVDLYNSTGRSAQEWQELILADMMAMNDDGLWTHSKYGYSLPRRNGKNEVIAMRELYGLMKGEHILHTAHRTTTTHSAWERLMDLTELAGLEIVSSYRAYGKEHITVNGDGRIEFRTRTSKGGLGEGFDLLIIDEAQEYQDDQESALKYTVTDSKNPQTILTGTPPTPISSGEASALEATGLFEAKKAYTSGTTLYTGDVLVTKTKGHTVIVVAGKLSVDGEIGKKTVTKLQRVMGQTGSNVDGFIDGQDAKQEKYWTSILSEACKWTGGSSAVVKKLQQHVKDAGYSPGTVDGELGTKTAKAVQRYLIAKGYSCGSAGADGYFGANSAKGLQNWLNAN